MDGWDDPTLLIKDIGDQLENLTQTCLKSISSLEDVKHPRLGRLVLSDFGGLLRNKVVQQAVQNLQGGVKTFHARTREAGHAYLF